MELLDTTDPMLQRDDEDSSLEADAQKSSFEPESYLHNLTLTAIFAFRLAIDALAIGLEESTELPPDFVSLKRSFERLKKCTKGDTIPNESSVNRSNMLPQQERVWQERKYRALRRVMEVVIPRLLYSTSWTNTRLPALEDSRRKLETQAATGDRALDQILREFFSPDLRPRGEDEISYIRESLASGTMYLMELQDAGYSNREAEASCLRIYHKLYVDNVKVEPAERKSLGLQMEEACWASDKLVEAWLEAGPHPKRNQAMSTMEEMEEYRSKVIPRTDHMRRLLSLDPTQDGNATNTACPSTCASSAASSTS